MPWYGFPSISRIRDIIPFITRVTSRTISETITVGDLLDRIFFAFRQIPQPASFSPTSFSSTSFSTAFGPAGVTLGESLSLVKIRVREITESITIPFFNSYTLASFTTASFGFTIATHTLQRIAYKAREIIESVTTTGIATLVRTVIRALATETVTISEALTFLISRPTSVSETVTIGESLARALTKARALAETIVSGDALAKTATKTRPLTETVIILEAPTLLKVNGRAVSETITITDNAAATRVRVRSLAETVTISDSLARSRIPNRTLAETVSITDLAERTRIKSRTAADTVGISEALTNLNIKTRTVPETVTVSDALARVTSKARSILALPEAITILESLLKGSVKAMSLTETVVISEALRFGNKIIKSLTETVTITDAVTRLIIGPGQWVVSGKPTDFTDKIDNLVKAYVAANWSISTPAIGTNLSTQATQNNFSYDHFRTYYIRILEGQSRVVNREIRQRLYEFETPITFECYSRRLSKGEAFAELNNMLNELMRIFGEFQVDDIFGLQGVTFDSITPIGNDSAAKSVWQRDLKIVLHYYKVDNSPL